MLYYPPVELHSQQRIENSGCRLLKKILEGSNRLKSQVA